MSAVLLPCIVVHAQDTTDTTTTEVTNEELASYGLNLTEFGRVRASESPADFGGLENQDDTDQLWLDAAVFEYEIATSHSLDHAITSPGYHPYLICSTYPNSSGVEREQKVDDLFQNTPNISVSHYYTGGNLFHNDDYVSCGIIRAYDDTINKIYEANPNASETMSVNPLSSSMKMVENTVEILQSWFDEEVSGDIVKIGSAENDNIIQVYTLGLEMVLCPGVQDFNNVIDVNDTLIVDDIRNFVTENGGQTVENYSFYHHRVTGEDDDDAVYTERMAQWSAAVSNVTSWTKEDGSNVCLDNLITDAMDWTIVKLSLEVVGKKSFREMNEMIESLKWTEKELETCIWYLTYGLALDPMVCSMQPATGVKTLCKDGTSDLSKCPPTPPTSSSSRTTAWTRSLVRTNSVVCLMMTMLVSVVGGVIML